MAKLVVLITAQADSALDVATLWREAGAPGVTFIEGYGVRSLHQAAKSLEVPSGMLSMLDIMRHATTNSVVTLSLVNDAALASRMLELVEAELGDMHAPHKGIAFVLDVSEVVGL
ncbi:MAG: hypothetical protein JNL34_03930 [Anaerolineae bacterium]|nr:hypothetical protein [Anaerolineae bacterium]